MLYNVKAYHLPTDIDEALRLLQRGQVTTLALYDDLTTIPPEIRSRYEEVVDLSALGLAGIAYEADKLHLGARTTLQTMVAELGDVVGGLLADTAHLTASWHKRNAATLGGLIASGWTAAPLMVALNVLGTRVNLTGGDEPIPLSALAVARLEGEIVTGLEIDVAEGAAGTAYEQVGRAPKDMPIVNAAAYVQPIQDGLWTAHVAVGGVLSGDLLRLDVSINGDTTDLSDLKTLTEQVNGERVDDRLGSQDYRLEMAMILARRTLTAALGQTGITVQA